METPPAIIYIRDELAGDARMQKNSDKVTSASDKIPPTSKGNRISVNLNKLLDEITAENLPNDVDWGEPVGLEEF